MNINEQQFEQLWEQAALRPVIDEMNEGLPAWYRRRRQNRNRAFGFVALCLLGGTVLMTVLPQDKRYDSVACNRPGMTDEQWLQIADDMLIAQV